MGFALLDGHGEKHGVFVIKGDASAFGGVFFKAAIFPLKFRIARIVEGNALY